MKRIGISSDFMGKAAATDNFIKGLTHIIIFVFAVFTNEE